MSLVPYSNLSSTVDDAEVASGAVASLFAGTTIIILDVTGQRIAGFVHSTPATALMNSAHGIRVLVIQGRITPTQTLSHRPSYINALLIQSRGYAVRSACADCVRGTGPFPQCRRAPGHFSGACGNCKWRDHASRCSVRDGQHGGEVDSNDDSDSNGTPAPSYMQFSLELAETETREVIDAEE